MIGVPVLGNHACFWDRSEPLSSVSLCFPAPVYARTRCCAIAADKGAAAIADGATAMVVCLVASTVAALTVCFSNYSTSDLLQMDTGFPYCFRLLSHDDEASFREEVRKLSN